ncbi:MAG: EFR1 family ferrodoxin, partial [Spirochaetales bacterium]|nr:EFR1 family ferrodoxin [Spirochaetales bacterium]
KLMKEKEWTIEGESVGIIFPCYYGTIPRIVRDFIKKAETLRSDYFYGLVTAGGSPGYSLTHLKDVLKKRGRTLHYGDKLILATNYMNGWYYDRIMPDVRTLEKRWAEVTPFCEKALHHIKEKKVHPFKDSYKEYVLPRLLTPARYLKDTRQWDREFRISGDCIDCGICKQVCPVDNIKMKEKGPIFLGNCQRCMACIQFCPQQAFSIKGKPMNKQHYSHPEVTVQDLQKLNA